MRTTLPGWLLLSLLAWTASSQDSVALQQLGNLYGGEPGEWSKGLLVQLRIDDHPAHLFLTPTGETRLQTELPQGRLWDVLGPEGAWRCQPREVWPLQGRSHERLRLLGLTFRLLALWPLLEEPVEAEGRLLLRCGAKLELGLDPAGHPNRFTLVEPNGKTLEVVTLGARLKKTPRSPAWPQRLRVSVPGQEHSWELRLESMRPFTFLDPGFFRPRQGLPVQARLLPESHPVGRLLVGREEPEQTVVLNASPSATEQDNVLMFIGAALVEAGFSLSRLPAYVHEPEGWRVLIPFSGKGPAPKGLEKRLLPGGTYARLYLEGPWDESVLKGVVQLEQLLLVRGLRPTGPVLIVPFRRPGFLLMPFEQEERITEIRVRVVD